MTFAQFTEGLQSCQYLPAKDKTRIVGIASAMPETQREAFLAEMQAADKAIGEANAKDLAMLQGMEKTVAKEEHVFLKLENAQLESDERGQNLPSLESAIDDATSSNA